MLDTHAKLIFELGDCMQLICQPLDGKVVLANEIAKSQIRSDLEQCTLADILGAEEAERVLGLVGGTSNRQSGFVNLETPHGKPITARFEISHFPDEERDLVILAIREMSSQIGLGTRSPDGHMVGSITEVTSRIMHDVRNLIFPLIGHVELAMASIDTSTTAYTSLLDVQSACQNCEDDLGKLLDITQREPSPPSFIHPVDLMERAAKVLTYTLPKDVNIDIDVDPETPLIEVSLAECQQRIVDLTSLAFQQRGAFESVRLGAGDNCGGGVTCEVFVKTKKILDEATLASETELTRAFMNSLLIDSKMTGTAISAPESLTFMLEILPTYVSHATLKEQEPDLSVYGNENVIVFHRNAMMRDIITSQLGAKGYAIQSISDPQVLQQTATDQVEPWAIFVDCEPNDSELIQTLGTLLEFETLQFMIVAGDHEARAQDPRIHEMPRSYRLDEIPALLRRTFDERNRENEQAP